jgi:NTE family protein
MASAAIPTVFPAVPVEDRAPEIDGWYFDGGTRLNTPIKPALKLNAKRLIIVALNSPWLANPAGKVTHKFASRDKGPAAVDGAASIIQSVLVDPLVNDLHDLTSINRDLEMAGAAASKVDRDLIEYIVIAPPHSDTIGRIATQVFNDTPPKGDVGFVGGKIDAGRDPARGELLSYFFFDQNFARRLIDQGKKDAGSWIANHPHLWET